MSDKKRLWHEAAKRLLESRQYGQKGPLIDRIAEKTGVEPPTVYKWINGERTPRDLVGVIRAIADALGVQPAELIKDDPRFALIKDDKDRAIMDELSGVTAQMKDHILQYIRLIKSTTEDPPK